MRIDPASQQSQQTYKLMTGLIVPRPIGWISSVSADGTPNLAPFSFFNAICPSPPSVSVAISNLAPADSGERRKDTRKNISESGEFVVNIVDEANVRAMNESATDFPSASDEFEAAGLTAVPGEVVSAPRVGEAPASLECELSQAVSVGEGEGGATLIIGTVRLMHIRDDLINERNHIDIGALSPVGRLAGAEYARVRETYSIPRPSYDHERGEVRRPSA
ncbi:MAG: flavin reductase family protein [Rubrobacter sp.]|nr:flavin reductase family protein [Rubrobacter sp.]